MLQDSDGLELSIDFTAVDSMSCAFRELRLNVPRLENCELSTIKQWAENLSERITYLLENIGPLEFDPNLNQALIRSTPPQKSNNSIKFYEILLKAVGSGTFSLSRYESKSQGREQVDMQTTHEQLLKLTDDLVATTPT